VDKKTFLVSKSMYLCAMSQFVVSARKYRPTRFADVVGQAHVSETLKNALRNDHVAHAFLFCGPRGVGKTTNARILAKILNCTDRTPDFEACGACASCRAFEQNASFNITELDAASNNSVEHIRALVEQVRFAPQQGKYKVFIIDEVHMLSTAAFNAFLKTLEEPPSYAIFILATTEKHKIIPTILSRCQIFDFRRIQIPDTVAHLQHICTEEGIKADADALHIIAQKSDGALRDALSIFDRIVSGSVDRHITYADVIENLNVLDYDYYFRLIDALMSENISQVLLTFDDILKKGFDTDLFLNGLAKHIRDLLVCKDEATLSLLEVGDALRERYRQQARLSSSTFLLSALNLCNECDVNFKMARDKKLHVEMMLIKIAYIQRAVDLARTPIGNAAPVEKKTPDHKSDERLSDKSVQKRPSSVILDPQTDIAPGESTPAPDVAMPNSSGKTLVANVNSDMVQIGSLADIQRKIAEEEALLASVVSRLSAETLAQSWQKYSETAESPSLRTTMQTAKLALQDTVVSVRTTTEFAVNILMNEHGLLTFLRFDLSTPDLTLDIQYDATLAPAEAQTVVPMVKKYLNPREKLKMMMEVNPLVKDLAIKFNLKPDDL
jgi:DNA polymerase III subunit gamma/tau